MTDYTNEIEDVYASIKESGAPILVRIFDTIPVVNEPWKPGTPKVIEFPTFGLFTRHQEKYSKGSEIHVGDQVVLVPAKGLTINPNLNGELIRDPDGAAEIWKIVKIVALKPGNQEIMFTMKVEQ